MAGLSRERVCLICYARLPEPLEDLWIKGIPDGPLREFLEFHGFKSLLARLNSGGSASAATPEAAARRAVPAQPQVRPVPKIDRSANEPVTDEPIGRASCRERGS